MSGNEFGIFLELTNRIVTVYAFILLIFAYPFLLVRWIQPCGAGDGAVVHSRGMEQ